MRRALSAERAELLRKATAESVLDHLRVAGVNVPSNILAQGLAAALVEMLGHVNVRHRADVVARCRLALDMAERREKRVTLRASVKNAVRTAHSVDETGR